MVIWLIGLSGAGKSTIGRELYKLWKTKEQNTVFVDGDEIREIFQHDRSTNDYTAEGRQQNARRISELCLWLDRQDINVVCCILSIFPKMRSSYREKYMSYYEVYVSTPLNILEERDTKGLYGAAKRGDTNNIVGFDIPFPEPKQSDLVIDGSGNFGSPEFLARKIYNHAIANEE